MCVSFRMCVQARYVFLFFISSAHKLLYTSKKHTPPKPYKCTHTSTTYYYIILKRMGRGKRGSEVSGSTTRVHDLDEGNAI
jgi:hypothetical protein